MTAKVSVVIPNYNRSGLVNETVRNVLAQTLRPHEVIVVDDGSTDDSVTSLSAEFGDQIQLICQKNQGPGAARNAGLERVTGEFIWLMDSDDLASLNKLEVQVDALESHTADVVYSPWARVFFDNSNVSLECPVLQQAALPANRDVLTWFMTDWSLVFQHCLFRTSIIRKAGDYRTDMWTCDDSEYFVRILCAGAKVIFDDRSITLYRCDDHGKVTGSGFRNIRRMTDWGSCLLAMADVCGLNSPPVIHPHFQQRLWESAKELRRHAAEETELVQKLDSLRTKSDVSCQFTGLVQRYAKSMRTRLTGTHWAMPYQTAELTGDQKRLIRELGYGVV